MRLIKIGRSQENDIVLRSPRSSSRHAELTIMNSGEILLEDKSSTNGTFLMGKRIRPSSPVSVKRGDRIQFADEELKWEMVPIPEDNSNFKAIYGIGSNFRNEIQIDGNTISRFHATLKIDKSGKAFIVDHSTNGTTVNGSKIPSNHPTRIKRRDSIVCGGIPVDLGRYIPADTPKIAMFSAIGVAALVAIVLLVGNLDISFLQGHGRSASLEALQDATVCVYGSYYIDIQFEDDPIAKYVPNWASNWTLGIYRNKWTLLGNCYEKSDAKPCEYSGTAFFVSSHGELATNRHVAMPWDYLSAEEEEQVRQEVETFLENSDVPEQWLELIMAKTDLDLDGALAMYNRLLKSPIKITGHHDYLGVCYNGTMVHNIKDIENAQVIASSEDRKKDVALLRLNSKMTPSYILKNGYFDLSKARVDYNKLKPQEEIQTIGYPGGLEQGLSSFNLIAKELRTTTRKSYISKAPNEDNFEMQMEVISGGSGSPVMDSHGRLLGIAFGDWQNKNIGYVCNIKNFIDLYEKNKVL